MRWMLALALAACSSSSGDVPAPDAERGWATYTIAAGAHTADLTDRTRDNPIDGIAAVAGRDYELALDASAIYELVDPVEPEDRFDWNKLPGLSDCGTVDLAENGAMFGWRWSVDTRRLEITAYANNDGAHLTPPAPLFELDPDELAAAVALRYRLWRDGERYGFEVIGEVAGRAIAASATLPRICPGYPVDELAWAGAFYFGGTSVAPHAITARIRERDFAR